MIAIVDYGMGNIGSVANMLRKIGTECVVAGEPASLRGARKLVLPGVGAFDQGMTNLRERGLVELLNELVVERRIPILGICLGMQLLTRGSEEGTLPGLGWVAGQTVRFPGTHGGAPLRVPHMGWNTVRARPSSPLFAKWESGRPTRFYFVHSYHVVCDEADVMSSEATYGSSFCASIEREHIFGVQFHPEKSHQFGMRLLRNYAELS